MQTRKQRTFQTQDVGLKANAWEKSEFYRC